MSFHLHQTLPYTVFFSSTEDEEKKCGDGGETERKPFEDPLLQRAKIQEEKEKKPKQKSKGKKSEPHPRAPPKAKRSEKTGAAAAAEAARAVESPGRRWGQKGPKMSIC